MSGDAASAAERVTGSIPSEQLDPKHPQGAVHVSGSWCSLRMVWLADQVSWCSSSGGRGRTTGVDSDYGSGPSGEEPLGLLVLGDQQHGPALRRDLGAVGDAVDPPGRTVATKKQ